MQGTRPLVCAQIEDSQCIPAEAVFCEGLAGSNGTHERVDFGMTSLSELWASAEGGPTCLCAAAAGDALTGTALAVGLSGAEVLCLWPTGGTDPAKVCLLIKSQLI